TPARRWGTPVGECPFGACSWGALRLETAQAPLDELGMEGQSATDLPEGVAFAAHGKDLPIQLALAPCQILPAFPADRLLAGRGRRRGEAALHGRVGAVGRRLLERTFVAGVTSRPRTPVGIEHLEQGHLSQVRDKGLGAVELTLLDVVAKERRPDRLHEVGR